MIQAPLHVGSIKSIPFVNRIVVRSIYLYIQYIVRCIILAITTNSRLHPMKKLACVELTNERPPFISHMCEATLNLLCRRCVVLVLLRMRNLTLARKDSNHNDNFEKFSVEKDHGFDGSYV